MVAPTTKILLADLPGAMSRYPDVAAAKGLDGITQNGIPGRDARIPGAYTPHSPGHFPAPGHVLIHIIVFQQFNLQSCGKENHTPAQLTNGDSAGTRLC
jgi:hypothetical protein